MLEVNPATKRYKVRLGDLELLAIHKFANTFSDYRNASVWQAPECLANMRKI
jgi:Protein tyrosine and serine/threonine kinase